MNKRKKMGDFDGDEHIDRISDLPDCVIDSILQCLPIEDIVRTSILSRKWRHTWTSVPRTAFQKEFFEKYKHVEACAIITHVLLQHSGPLNKFIVTLPDYPIRMDHLSDWTQILSWKGVNYVAIVNELIDPYLTPPHIFSCLNLTHLSLHNFILPIAPNFHGFKAMIELHFGDIIFEPGGLDCLLSGCPLLRKLTLYYCSGFESINVSSSFLQYLDIEGYQVIKSVCLKQPQNLTSIDLFADQLGNNIEKAWVYDLLKELPYIHRLSIGGGYIQILSTDIRRQLQLPDIETLELYTVNLNETRELLFALSLIERSYNLEKLVIKCDSMAGTVQQFPKEFHRSKRYFNYLEDVNIRVKTSFKPALELIQFVLARSPALKNLTFRICLHQSYASLLTTISDDLLKMKRASSKVQVKFLYDDNELEY